MPYAETFGNRDLDQLADPEDGELDEVHALLDRTGADLVHLIVGRPYDVCGIAFLPMLGWPGPFGICWSCGRRLPRHTRPSGGRRRAGRTRCRPGGRPGSVRCT